MNRAVVGVSVALLMLSAAPPTVASASSQDPQLGATTTLAGAHAQRFAVEVPDLATIDLTVDDGTGLPAALSVQGGSGFRGFLLVEAGALDGFAALAVQFPDPVGPATEAGIGWGRAPAGDACTQCTLDPGNYQLYLLTGGHMFSDSPDEPTVVSMRLDGLEGDVHLDPAEGEAVAVFQHAVTHASSEDAQLGGGGGAWTWVSMSTPWTGLLLDHMAAASTGRLLPPLSTYTEYCRDIGPDRHCDDDMTLLQDYHREQVTVTPFAVPEQSWVGAGMHWDVLGDADYAMTKHVLFVDLDALPVIEAGPEPSPQLSTWLQLW